MSDFLQRNRKLLLVLGALGTAGAVFVLVWFQPQKLFIEENVNEELPGASGKQSTSSPEEPADSGPEILAEGMFQSLEHETTGSARIVELADGTQLLRFEDLDTSNGPDLRVYLSEIPASDDWRAYGERFIDLGVLKGNTGITTTRSPREQTCHVSRAPSSGAAASPSASA